MNNRKINFPPPSKTPVLGGITYLLDSENFEWNFNEKGELTLNFKNGIKSSSSNQYIPLFSDQSSCTVELLPNSTWYWKKIGDIVSVWGIAIMTLSSLASAGSVYFNLPVEPANNWSDYYQLGGTVNVYGLSTGDLGDLVKLGLTTDTDTPSKRVLLSIGVEPSAAGDEIIFGVNFSYSLNN